MRCAVARILPTTYRQARDLADACRAEAYRVRDEHVLREAAHRAHWRDKLRKHWWQFWRPVASPLHLPFNIAVDRRVKADPRFKEAVSDNQWYIMYATMYAQGQQLAEFTAIRENLDLMIAARTSPTLQRMLTQERRDT